MGLEGIVLFLTSKELFDNKEIERQYVGKTLEAIGFKYDAYNSRWSRRSSHQGYSFSQEVKYDKDSLGVVSGCGEKEEIKFCYYRAMLRYDLDSTPEEARREILDMFRNDLSRIFIIEWAGPLNGSSNPKPSG